MSGSSAYESVAELTKAHEYAAKESKRLLRQIISVATANFSPTQVLALIADFSNPSLLTPHSENLDLPTLLMIDSDTITDAERFVRIADRLFDRQVQETGLRLHLIATVYKLLQQRQAK